MLEEWLGEYPNARMVVIDVLKMIRTPESGNRGVYSQDYEALRPLIPLAAKYGVAIVVVHHTRKMAAADPLDEISGSTGLSGGADGILVLKRDRGRADAYLHVTGRDIEEEQELALRWDQNVAGWTIVGDAEEYRLTEQRQAVIRAMEEAGEPMTPREVADAVGGDYNSTRQRLYQMSRAGEISSAGRGRYTLPNNPNKPNKPHRNGESVVRALESPNNHPNNESPIDKANVTNVRDVRRDSGRRLSGEEVQQVRKLIHQGMAPALARQEVIGKEA